jgi:hypothetical protein
VKDPISTKNKDKTSSPREPRRNLDSSSDSTVSQPILGLEELEELRRTGNPLPLHIFEDIDSQMATPTMQEPSAPDFLAPNQNGATTLATVITENDTTSDVDRTKVNEIKLNPPKPFTGKREELRKFIQDVVLYLLVNEKTYNNDVKKIAFALSFMNDGDAASWKEQFLDEAAQGNHLNLGTWDAFMTKLNEAFKPYDGPGDALEEMKTLRMGNNTIEDHIAKFKMLVTKSELADTSPAVIDYFRETLQIPLQRRLLSLEKPPTTLKEWYEWALRLDNNFRRMQRILGRNNPGKDDRGKNNKKEEPRRRWNFQSQRRDPDAMDVDMLTTEQHDEMMRKGLCFGCGKPGHIGKNCPDKRKPTNTQKKMNGKELLAHIRSLTMHMDDDEKEKFYDEAEKEGF